MQYDKTKITIIGTAIIVALLGFMVGLYILSLGEERQLEPLDCSRYAKYTVESLPVGCYSYYNIINK